MPLRVNVIANYVGQAWTSLMGIAFVPFYIRYLGMEAYGLIGIFSILQAWLTLLDMGMTPTLNREMARYTAGAHTAQSIRDLLRSIEVICFAIALLIGITIYLLAPWLSVHWLQAEKLPTEKVAQAISIIGFVVALRFIESLYRGAILGLQKQVWLSAVGSGLATLRWAGAVIVLMFIPSIQAFFIWQGLVSLVSVIIFGCVVHLQFPKAEMAAKFSWSQLDGIRRFAGGMMLTTLLALLLMQVDKIILSRMLSLEMFGYYTLAGTVAAVLYQLTGPITQAYYPRFTELLTNGDIAGLTRLYHHGAQLLSVIIIPAALMLIFFGENILLLWTGSDVLAQNVAPLLALLVLGTMLNGLVHIPYMLTLAYAWTGFAIRLNLVAVTLLVPAILLVTPKYGALGAASIWVILNVGYVLFGMHYLHKKLLKSEKRHWCLHDVIFPALGALGAVCLSWLIQPDSMTKVTQCAWLLGSGVAVLVASAISTQIFRKEIKRLMSGISKHAC